jgi:magnesium transporter
VITVRVYRDGADHGEIAPDLAAAHAVLAEGDGFVWIDASEPTSSEITEIADCLQLHPLTVEDVRHRHQRPKVELFERYAFVVVRPMRLVNGELEESEVHALVAERYLATLRYDDAGFDPAKLEARWLRQPELFKAHPGGSAIYFAIDDVVDGYLSVVEQLEDQADDLEDIVIGDAIEDPRKTQERIFRVKRSVVRLRRAVSPLRQGLDLLMDDSRMAGEELLPYFRDVTEHVIRVAELADNIRDLLTSMIELEVAKEANRLNDTVRSLTAWAAILVVPTLIASIYGMNFEVMPELRWHFGYGFALVLMLGSSVALWISFKKRGWL